MVHLIGRNDKTNKLVESHTLLHCVPSLRSVSLKECLRDGFVQIWTNSPLGGHWSLKR